MGVRLENEHWGQMRHPEPLKWHNLRGLHNSISHHEEKMW